MSVWEIIILAIALSIDAMVVSFSQGLVVKEGKIQASLQLASWQGAFQAVMPIIGWLLAGMVYAYISKFAVWISFLIFLFLGLKFIFDAMKKEVCEQPSETKLTVAYLFAIAIATSIDACAAGVSIYFLNAKILFPALFIGLMTFLCSNLGFFIASKIKCFPSKYLEIFGGIILVGLAIKALF